VLAVGVRTADAKLIRFDEETPRFVRYDLASDPGETTPIPTGAGDPLVARLEAWIEEQRSLFERRNGPDDGAGDVRTPDEIRQLRAFGYLR